MVKITACSFLNFLWKAAAAASPVQNSGSFHRGRISTEHKTKAGIRATRNCDWKTRQASNSLGFIFCVSNGQNISLQSSRPRSFHTVFGYFRFVFRLPPSRCRNFKTVLQYKCFSSLCWGQVQGTMTQCLQLTKPDANAKSISFKVLIQLHKGGQKVLALVSPAHLRRKSVMHFKMPSSFP